MCVTASLVSVLLLAGVAHGLHPDCVMVYKDCNYAGESIEYCQDQRKLDYWASGKYYWHFNDAISSVRIGGNVRKVSLYEHGQYGGGVYHVYEDHSCLSGVGFNDKASSLQIEVVPLPKDCVRMWKGRGSGGFHDFCQNTPVMPAGWDGKAKTVAMGSSVVDATLYYDDHFQGSAVDVKQVIATGSTLPPYVSSITLDAVGHNCIRAFSSEGFAGSQQEFCGETAQLGWWDNRMHSFIVGRDVRTVYLYMAPNFNNWAYPTNPEWIATGSMGHIGFYGGKVSSFKVYAW